MKAQNSVYYFLYPDEVGHLGVYACQVVGHDIKLNKNITRSSRTENHRLGDDELFDTIAEAEAKLNSTP